VSFSSGSPTICTVLGSTVHYVAVGSCVVLADQAGDANYYAAPQVSGTVVVVKSTQTISFTPPTSGVVGGSATLSATASSGLPVSFSSGSLSICTVAGNTVSFIAAGPCTVNADQAGDASFNPAPQVSGTITVAALPTLTQNVQASPLQQTVLLNAPFSIAVDYDTSDANANLTGLGLRIHFDSTQLNWNTLTNVLATDRIAQDTQPVADTLDFDGDPVTDRYLTVAWASLAGAWPGGPLPAHLYDAQFTLAPGMTDGSTTTIRFSASSTASGYLMASPAVLIQATQYTLNIDGSTDLTGAPAPADALTDGILVLRYLFGFTGNTLINGALGPTATRTTAPAIEAYLLGAEGAILDVDGNGAVDALTDGILTLRYLFGFTGNALINGAVGAGATRTTAQIEAYLGGIR